MIAREVDIPRTVALFADGRRWNYSDPRAEDVSIRGIITSLSRIQRFAGQCPIPYTVGQHSVRVMRIAVMKYPDGGEDLRWAALMHDAHEAYVGDIVSPMLRSCVLLREMVQKTEYAVREALGITHAHDAQVLEADRIAYEGEREKLFGWGDCFTGQSEDTIPRECGIGVGEFEVEVMRSEWWDRAMIVGGIR